MGSDKKVCEQHDVVGETMKLRPRNSLEVMHLPLEN